MSDDKEWSREGKESEESEPEKEVVEGQILAQAETITEPIQTTENSPYDKHLRFIGKKLGEINLNFKETNEHLSWLSLVLKIMLTINAFFIFILLILYILSFGD